VDEAGKLQIRKDVYGRDATMLALLKNGRSKDLENVVAHSQPSYAHPTGNLPTGVNFASDNSYYGSGGSYYGSGGPSYSGPSFFERLFGAPTPPAPIPGRRQQQRRLFTR
jgi:L,D-transpeptidase YcbB